MCKFFQILLWTLLIHIYDESIYRGFTLIWSCRTRLANLSPLTFMWGPDDTSKKVGHMVKTMVWWNWARSNRVKIDDIWLSKISVIQLKIGQKLMINWLIGSINQWNQRIIHFRGKSLFFHGEYWNSTNFCRIYGNRPAGRFFKICWSPLTDSDLDPARCHLTQFTAVNKIIFISGKFLFVIKNLHFSLSLKKLNFPFDHQFYFVFFCHFHYFYN
jgi:hypothetical protein